MNDIQIGKILCDIQGNECPRCLIREGCNIKNISISELNNNKEKYSHFLQLFEKYKSCGGKSSDKIQLKILFGGRLK